MNKDASDVILQYLQKDDSLTLEELTQKLRDKGINVSRETVCRKLKQIGYVPKVPIKGHELLLQQIEVRLKWCKKYKNKDYWDNVFFIDEKLLK